jgi:pimeloyl-ACP methyl ester carboxylesterase
VQPSTSDGHTWSGRLCSSSTERPEQRIAHVVDKTCSQPYGQIYDQRTSRRPLNAIDLVDHYPHASLAVVDDAGHALPHEQPELLRALLAEWLTRVERSS